MATKKKMLQAAAGQAGGAALDITDVFSTYLYTGNGSTQTITNDIDLAGEGGLVWTKSRETGYSHELIDTERGIKKTLRSNGTDAEGTVSSSAGFSSFNSNGYSIAGQFGTWGSLNVNNEDHVSWTFRKAPKFFDVVTYTGTASVQNISHNLGSVPGMIIVKRLDSSSFNWQIYHRNSNATPEDYRLEFTTGAAQLNTGVWGGTAPTDTHFTVGVNGDSNGSGGSFVAYLFAHNDGDGGFGPSGDQDIIKCGSYTGNGSTDGPEIDLGFEPQWVMIKSSSNADNWNMYDNMRGVTGSSSDPRLVADQANAEITGFEGPQFNATGFKMVGTAVSNGSGREYIYMAIRRGPLAQPESGTEVFAPIAYTTTDGTWQDRILESNFTTDLSINGYRNITDGGTHTFVDRLRGYANILRSHQTSAESIRTGDYYPWPQTGQSVTSNEWSKYNGGNGLDYYNYQWKRAPGFFDVVAYTGDGVQGRNIEHNLGVAPDMMWIKNRDQPDDWAVYVSGITHLSVFGSDPSGYGDNPVRLELNTTEQAQFSGSGNWDHTHPTSSVFRVGDTGATNGNGEDLIAYLFASLPGVSKVGSYTGNGSSQTIDCGFTSGARFVLIKRTNNQSPWWLWDSERGIVAGNDPYLELNSTAAENTSTDYIDPYASGFALNSNGNWLYGMNYPSGEYIFYAIA